MMAGMARPLRERGDGAAAARRFLERRFGGGVEMGDDLPQGAWSRAYAFRQAGRELVVRFNPDRLAFDVDRLALRFASPALPIPDVFEVGAVDGDYYAISERCFGDFLEDLAPERVEAAIPSLLATLEALRTADTSGSSGFGPWDENGDGRNRDWSEFLLAVDAGTPEAFRNTWRRDLARNELAERTFREGMRELDALAWRCPNRRDLVHSDLLHGNAFVSGARIAGLIDWQCALYGDHLYELAWLTFCAPPWAPGLAAVGLRDRALDHWRAAEVDLTDFDVRLRCYEIRIGVSALVGNTWRRDLPNREAAARRLAEVLG
jgi:aminoglycoside phosphotransferase (APT) family kinase protein